MNYHQYYTNRVCTSKTDLPNPRISFNHGFHSAVNDIAREKDLQDVYDHFNPYYKFGYLMGQEKWAHKSTDSSYAWSLFLSGLADEDYETTCAAIMEARILGYEYLFSEKHPRHEFEQHTWKQIIQQYDRDACATNAKQMAIKFSILKRFNLS